MHQILFNIITIIGHFVPLRLIMGLRHLNQPCDGYFIGVPYLVQVNDASFIFDIKYCSLSSYGIMTFR